MQALAMATIQALQYKHAQCCIKVLGECECDDWANFMVCQFIIRW